MFDPVQLRSFLAVARTRSFTAAARRLNLRQSTVSQHVAKLEIAAGRRLFLRDTHSVELTADGSVMVGFATSILERHSDAERYFTQSGVRGRVRFGASEDLVLHELPRILGEFRRSHPLVDLELTVALSEVLFRQLHDGSLDLVFGKRRRGDRHGELVWTDRLAFFAAPDFVLDTEGPVPLVAYPPPSITRQAALDVLEKSGRGARVACVTDSLNGLRAACLAGLGVVFHAETLPPAGLVPVRMRSREDWGPAVDVEFVLEARRSVLSEPEQALRAAILENADRLRA
ncbi:MULTISPECIES: LysR family transcriptional regulator [unclassified Rhodococcus (in: high G+C Gram-positive bacteria)]|uniref:LysR family transcriptional regulator n=1 Tax=unclassified Rhodococcus (in: high G+C Gram-positive bacteria) TaxID=192944 RepID=UPI001639ED9A|nr:MULTISPECIES: LysR family transcriptional regulator [unclassified Rhodococcus (in: high G+C Gram-positive bacteria)]MBC2641655.1 LysR family transcriptional regulator [Rhodococcus sp. 3A]MBC2893600.1 LysR family transcriptional regulator [Rhodococcus sp. 4CII]